MSFWIYHRLDRQYTRLENIKLTGNVGLLSRFLTAHSHEETPFTWQLSAADLITMANPDLEASQHCLVLDMIPGCPDEVSLYRVSHIQGSSEMDESDIVLASRILYQNTVPGKAHHLRRSFLMQRQESSRQMLEALRLTGGTFRGKYFWAKPKMDIGAAVCPSSSISHEPQLKEA